MLTALITAGITWVLRAFGVNPSVATVATTYVVVKVLIVLALGGYLTRGFLRDRKRSTSAGNGKESS